MAEIILAEDHVLVRQGIRRIIEEDPNFQVTHEVGNGVELMERLDGTDPPPPDMVVIDISMPRLHGLDAAKLIKQLYPRLKILILTMHGEKDYLRKAQEIGVNGYVLKDEADTDLNFAIKTVLEGNTYVSPLIS